MRRPPFSCAGVINSVRGVAALPNGVGLRHSGPMSTRLDFATLVAPKTPNWYLTAPKGLCRKATPQDEAPIFPLTPDRLWDRLLTVVAREPRVTINDQDKAALYLDFTQVSLLFRFPDRVTMQILSAGEGSTLAIFSRSKYGRSDLGVNAKRVKRLLAALAHS
jgi:uncharacterized protein (DUF1499 family)